MKCLIFICNQPLLVFTFNVVHEFTLILTYSWWTLLLTGDTEGTRGEEAHPVVR